MEMVDSINMAFNENNGGGKAIHVISIARDIFLFFHHIYQSRDIFLSNVSASRKNIVIKKVISMGKFGTKS